MDPLPRCMVNQQTESTIIEAYISLVLSKLTVLVLSNFLLCVSLTCLILVLATSHNSSCFGYLFPNLRLKGRITIVRAA